MSSVLKTSLFFLAHTCRIVLALVFLWSGALKGLDPEGFARQIAEYGLVSGGLATLGAYVLIPLEMSVGMALLINFRTVPSLIVGNGLLLMFIGAIGYALLTDQPLQSCGCFGKNIVRTPEQTLVEDIILLVGGILTLWILRSEEGEYRAIWKRHTLVVATVGSSVFTIVSPHLPIDDWVTAVSPGVQWEELSIPLAEVDLSQGDHFVALMSLTEQASLDSIEGLNQLASIETFNVLAIYSGNEQAYATFFWTHGPAFPMYGIASNDMSVLHRRLPRFFVVADGVVEATWVALPTGTAVADVMKSERNP